MMENIFIAVLNLALASSFLALAIFAVHLLLKKAPKWILCALWGLLALRLLIPFTPETPFGAIPSAEVVPRDLAAMETPAIDSGISAINSFVNPLLQTPAGVGESLPEKSFPSVLPEKEETKNSKIETGVRILSFIWLSGCAAMLGYAFFSAFLIRRKMREAVRAEKGVWRCDGHFSPFILGVFRPRIYLPSSLPEKEAKYVLAHERAHLKRKDHLWKPLGFLLLCVYWFHPLLWISYYLLCRDIEFACDEKVIKDLGEEGKKPYSEALLACSVSRKALAACPLAFGENSVKERVKNVLNYKKPSFWILIGAIVITAGLTVFFCTRKKAEEAPEEPKTEASETEESFADVLHTLLNETDAARQGAMVYRSVAGEEQYVLAITPGNQFMLTQNNGELLVHGFCGTGENSKGEFIYVFDEGEPTESHARNRMELTLDGYLLHFDPEGGNGFTDSDGNKILTKEAWFTPFTLKTKPPQYQGAFGTLDYDFDADGVTEHYSMEPGGTSGVFSLRVGTYTYQKPRLSAFVTTTAFSPCFQLKDGRFYIADQDDGSLHFEIVKSEDGIRLFDLIHQRFAEELKPVPWYLGGQDLKEEFQNRENVPLLFDDYTVSVFLNGKDAEAGTPRILFQRKDSSYRILDFPAENGASTGKYLFDPAEKKVTLLPDDSPTDKVIPYVFRMEEDSLVAVSGRGIRGGERFEIGYRAEMLERLFASSPSSRLEADGITYLYYDSLFGGSAVLAEKDGKFIGESVFQEDGEFSRLELGSDGSHPVLSSPDGEIIYRILFSDGKLLVVDRDGENAYRLTTFRGIDAPLSRLLEPGAD